MLAVTPNTGLAPLALEKKKNLKTRTRDIRESIPFAINSSLK